jgi:alpha-tubulin suppressor-like RCC1 family protein
VGGTWLFRAPVRQVAAGVRHTAAVNEEGVLFIWGNIAGVSFQGSGFSHFSSSLDSGLHPLNFSLDDDAEEGTLEGDSLLGFGDEMPRFAPAALGQDVFGGLPVAMVACGSWHTMAQAGGHVWTWGRGLNGQLGHGDLEDRAIPSRLPDRHGAWRVVFVAACETFSMSVSACGRVCTWGEGEHSGGIMQLVPTQIDQHLFHNAPVVMTSAGGGHAAAVTNSGSLFTWGRGREGQLGLGDYDDRLQPTFVAHFQPSLSIHEPDPRSEFQVMMASCGAGISLAVTRDGSLWAWGYGETGLLGLNDEVDRLVPTRISSQHFGGAKISLAAAGAEHSLALAEDGAVYTWGPQWQRFRTQAPTGLGQGNEGGWVGGGGGGGGDKMVPTRVLLGARIGRWYGVYVGGGRRE